MKTQTKLFTDSKQFFVGLGSLERKWV